MNEWTAITARLNLKGMAWMLADHCSLVAFDKGTVKLRIEPVHRHLLDAAYTSKLVAALRGEFGADLKVAFEVEL